MKFDFESYCEKYAQLPMDLIPRADKVEKALAKEEAEALALVSMNELLQFLAEQAVFPRTRKGPRQQFMIMMGFGYLSVLGDPSDQKSWHFPEMWPLVGAPFQLRAQMVATCIQQSMRRLPMATFDSAPKEHHFYARGMASGILIADRLLGWAISVTKAERFALPEPPEQPAEQPAVAAP